MGRLIDYNDVYNAIQITTDDFGVVKNVVETNMLTMLSKIPTVEAIPKDQYKARLKADMVAELTEIQVGIGEHINPSNHTDSYEDGWSEGAEWCIDYIQEKINALKGDPQ